VDAEALTRAQRRREALAALEFEDEREASLRGQLEAIVTEMHRSQIDEEVFARMAPEDVELARGIFESGLESSEEEFIVEDEPLADDREDREAELVRLEREIADSGRRQQALQHYLGVLGD
jgi:hypothetical protein